MITEEIAKTGTKKPGSLTSIISLVMAIASMAMGITSMIVAIMHMVMENRKLVIANDVICFGLNFGFAAVISSIISLRIINKWRQSCKVYAIAGLITGILGVIYFSRSHVGEQPRRVSCASNLKQIGLAIQMYSQENNNQFPDKSGAMGLEMLRSGRYLDNVHIYTCPSTTTKLIDNNALTEEVDYAYVGGYNENTPPDTPIAYDKPKNHYKFRNILFADGHVSGYAGENWMDNRKK
jgi:prepilin-type processing-associated H-X9-DG protein